ncbi:DUF2497 domain-containing protein [Sphingomonas sp.]|uniref:DUF2497 domain-containing protein n=1 Tax=Sphingomonas sp. TaxID=28214 RepID=UPI002B5616AA|nr:DUF2497 domain-containing protein [Sphingomonas sp.]HTG38240.1 DUF2497 domain-containing protein [Sphingomonas sp.]
MGDLSNEPSMEDILSSIKRIIAEEGDPLSQRGRRMGRPLSGPRDDEADDAPPEAVLELDQPVAPTRRPDAAPPEPPRPEPQRATFAAADPTPDPDILSPRVAEATRGRLEALSRLIVKPETAGGDTLEGLVREMLKPMLSEWLDANLPRIVETMVSREIARISGRDDR